MATRNKLGEPLNKDYRDDTIPKDAPYDFNLRLGFGSTCSNPHRGEDRWTQELVGLVSELSPDEIAYATNQTPVKRFDEIN